MGGVVMLWWFIGLGALVAAYAIHCVGGLKLKPFIIPTANWFHEIKLPNTRSWKPKDLLLMFTRMVLFLTLLALWVLSSCADKDISTSSESCLLVVDETWSTHSQWEILEAAFNNSSQECSGNWIWWFSQPSPWRSRKMPTGHSYKSKTLSLMLQEVHDWLRENSSKNGIYKVLVVTDGQVHADEGREEIDLSARQILRLGIQLGIKSYPPSSKTNYFLNIQGKNILFQSSLQNTFPQSFRITARCDDKPGTVNRKSDSLWRVNCPGKSKKETTFLQVSLDGVRDLFPDDDTSENLWVTSTGQTKVIVVDHNLDEILRRPSFFIQQAAPLLGEMSFYFQSYEPDIRSLNQDDVVIWFNPPEDVDLKLINRRAKLLVWNTKFEEVDQIKAKETLPTGTVKFRGEFFKIPEKIFLLFNL